MIVATGAPAEHVYPSVVGLGDVVVVVAHIVVLVFGKLPGVRRSLVLQVALREDHWGIFTHTEYAVDEPFCNVGLEVRHQRPVARYRERIVGIR